MSGWKKEVAFAKISFSHTHLRLNTSGETARSTTQSWVKEQLKIRELQHRHSHQLHRQLLCSLRLYYKDAVPPFGASARRNQQQGSNIQNIPREDSTNIYSMFDLMCPPPPSRLSLARSLGPKYCLDMVLWVHPTPRLSLWPPVFNEDDDEWLDVWPPPMQYRGRSRCQCRSRSRSQGDQYLP